MTGIEKLRNLSAMLGEKQPFALERIYIGDKAVSEWLADVADQIERETLPRPRFEDGEPVQFGDKYLSYFNGVFEVENIRVWSDGDYEVNGHMLSHKDKLLKRPEPPKVLDADGVEIKVGDEVWSTNDSGLVRHPFSFTVTEVEAHLVHGDGIGVLPCQVTHRRPEPPDSWEKITADVAKGYACHYFGFADDDGCDGCKANYSDMSCSWEMTNDVLGRAKKLAGVE